MGRDEGPLPTQRTPPSRHRCGVADDTRAGGHHPRQTGIDWTGLGYSPGDLDDIADLALRMLQSQLLSPDDSGDPGELRAKLLRWIRPAIDAGVTQASTD